MKTPACYYSTSHGQWRLILQGLPLCKDGTLQEASQCAAGFRLTPDPQFWDGDNGKFETFPIDNLQAAEAAAFTLAHTLSQPRSTSAQNPLF